MKNLNFYSFIHISHKHVSNTYYVRATTLGYDGNTEANCFSVWDRKRKKRSTTVFMYNRSAGSGIYWSRWLTTETLQSITQCLKSVTTSCKSCWPRLTDTNLKITTNTIQPELLTLVIGFFLPIFKDKITSHILDINSCMNCYHKQTWSQTAAKFSHNS